MKQRPTNGSPDARHRATEDEAGNLSSWRDSDESLAFYVTTVRFEGDSAPESVRREFERIQSDARRDPSLRLRIHEIERRLDYMAVASDGARQFERLTGHRLSAQPAVRPRRTPDGRSREPVRPALPRLGGLRGRATLAAATLFMCYGLLALISNATRPPYLDLALVHPDTEEVGQALRLRGGETDEIAAQHLRYLYAHILLTKARRSTLGLFTRYDQDHVQEAIDLLEDAVDQSDENSPLWRLSTLLLSRAYLSKGDVETARVSLLRLAHGSDAEAEEARTLLAALR